MAMKSATTATKKSGAAKKPVTATVKTETVKAETAKIAETEKVPEKTKAQSVKPAAKEAAVKPEAAAKPAAKKAPAKKAAAKRTAAAKKDMSVDYILEYQGRQVKEKEIIANVKKAWTRSGKKIGDIRTIELYVKPEEYMVYYVINGSETGSAGL